MRRRRVDGRQRERAVVDAYARAVIDAVADVNALVRHLRLACDRTGGAQSPAGAVQDVRAAVSALARHFNAQVDVKHGRRIVSHLGGQAHQLCVIRHHGDDT